VRRTPAGHTALAGHRTPAPVPGGTASRAAVAGPPGPTLPTSSDPEETPVSAKNLMDGLTAYANPEELASTAVAAQEQASVTISLISLISPVTISIYETTQ
jgi:hypothetical protein